LIRVSVSILDAFYKYIHEHLRRNGEPIYPDAQSFLDYISKKFEPTPDMEYGLAVDAIIENPPRYFDEEVGEYIYKGIAIPKEYIGKITPFFDYDFPFQVKGEELYQLGDTKVLLTARADQLCGLETVEFKATWTGYSYERYADSVQWKCYNIIFGTDRVRYVVADSHRSSGGDVQLKNIHQFYFDRAEKHEFEISSLLSELVDFLKLNDKIKELEVSV
jgi:hypothetical protein